MFTVISLLHFFVTFRCYILLLHFDVTFRSVYLSIYCQTSVYIFIFAPCNERPSTLQTVLLHLENAQTQVYFKRYYLWHWDLSCHKFAPGHRRHDKRCEYFSVYSIVFSSISLMLLRRYPWFTMLLVLIPALVILWKNC